MEPEDKDKYEVNKIVNLKNIQVLVILVERLLIIRRHYEITQPLQNATL